MRVKLECRKCCSRFGFFQIVEISEENLMDDASFPDEVISETMRDHDVQRDDAEFLLREALGFWTLYYQPEIEDVETAIRVGLVPFYYQERFYLALGGCGMDLSPKLDAYQVLTQGTIDPFSCLFSDPKYFRWVVGSKVFEEVLERLGIEEQDLLDTD